MLQRKQSHFQQELVVIVSTLRGKKINRASAQPAQGPSLKPSLQGRQCAFVFQSVGIWLGQEPEVRNVYGRKSRRVLSHAGWKLLAGGLRPQQRHPEPTEQWEQRA